MAKQQQSLFLWLNQADYFPKTIAEQFSDVVTIHQVFKPLSTIGKGLRNIALQVQWAWFVRLFLANWAQEVNNYSQIIIHASRLTPAVVKWLAKAHPTCRIIVWYWNPVKKTVPVAAFQAVPCEIWSFDEQDCQEYGLTHNTQYYFDTIALPEQESQYDALFVGADKGRLQRLLTLEKEIQAQGLTTYFHITPTKQSDLNQYAYHKHISYEGLLEKIAQCQIIVDFVSDHQSGLTLRPLEALFFEKKLITNDPTIVTRDFYCRNNIFVYGVDDLAQLPAFIQIPYQKVTPQIQKKYSFSHWFARF